MKKVLCLFSLFFISLTLSATIYESNVLMQRIAEVDEIPTGSWYIVEEGDLSILYNEEGEEVERLISTDEMEERITATSTVRRYFEDGILIREEETTEEGTTTLIYEYSENGNLKRVREVDGEGNESVRDYNYSSLGVISSITLEGSLTLFSSSAQSIDGSLYSYEEARSALLGILEGAGESEDGGYTTTETSGFGTIVRNYDSEQRLIKETWYDREEVAFSTTDYYYDREGRLFFSRRIDGERIEDSYFTSGVLVQTVLIEDGQVSTVNSQQDDGTIISLRYRNGRPYARIHYERDANRVLELEVL